MTIWDCPARKNRLKKTFKLVERYDAFSPKASMLVNGYHSIHKEFEETLCMLNKFEAGIVAGSGFLANLSLIVIIGAQKRQDFYG